MKRVYESCLLRREIQEGELPEDTFAARLADVEDHKAHPVYQDPETFFQRTHPTESLKELLALALGRLSGADPSANPVLRLETSFGGGKTHSLIALYHATQGTSPAVLAGFVDPALVPQEKVHVAAVVGTDLDPAVGVLKADGTRTFTLWGEIAFKLGGPPAFETMAEADRQGLAPGTRALESILPDGPCLIMIDEIARHLRVARGKVVAQGTLDGQVTAFLHSLFELAAARPRLVVVLTLASSSDAYGEETVEFLHRLQEMQTVLARVERTLRPVNQQDLAPVLRRRLFESLDASQAEEVAEAFQGWYKKLFDRNEAIPEEVTRAQYRQAIASSYPFHPHLLNTLEHKLSTLPQFQRTRGALRLLALILRHLYRKQPDDAYLVMAYDLDLAIPELVADVTSRLSLDLAPAIRADIVSNRSGDPAHAQAYDEPELKAGRPPIAIRVAQAIFLQSLSQGNAGCTPAELNLATVLPKMDAHLVEQAYKHLLDRGWHLHQDGLRLLFKEQANLKKVIATEVQHVAIPEAKDKLNNRIREVYGSGPFKLVAFPEDPADIPDDTDKPKLAVMHFDSLKGQGLEDIAPRLQRFLEYRSGNEFRRYPNNVVFLVAHETDISKILDTARRYQAIRNLASPERQQGLTKDQREELVALRNVTETELRIAVTACYRHLFYLSSNGLESNTLMLNEAAETQQQQQRVILGVLRELGKLQTGEDKALAANYVRSKVWPGHQDQLDLASFQAAFASKRDLPLVLDPALLKRTVADGVEKGIWGYDNGQRVYFKEKVHDVQLVATHFLLSPEEVARRKPAPEPAMPAPKGGKTVEGGPTTPPHPPVLVKIRPPLTYRAQAVPAGAFQKVQDEMEQHGAQKVRQLSLLVADPQDVPRLGLAIPRLSGFDVSVRLEMEAELASSKTEMTYQGDWEGYRAHLKGVVDGLIKLVAQQERDLSVELAVQLEARQPAAWSEPHQGFQQVRAALEELQVGKVELRVDVLEETQ